MNFLYLGEDVVHSFAIDSLQFYVLKIHPIYLVNDGCNINIAWIIKYIV